MKTVVQFCDRAIQRYLPDPFVIAIILTVATLAWAFVAQPIESRNAQQIIGFWGGGFWSLATFTLQMAMILIGGYVVAISKPVQQLLSFLISFVETPIAAVLFCTFAAIIASWINWGFGLVVGAIVALEVGKKLPNVPFRVLVASSYSGFLVWHGGLSGSIPLLLNSDGKLSTELIGETIPLSQTSFGMLNLVALASMVVLLPIVNVWNLSVCEGETSSFAKDVTKGPEVDVDQGIWLNRSWLPTVVLFGLAAAYWYGLFDADKFKLNLDSVTMIFFMVGLLLHGTPQGVY